MARPTGRVFVVDDDPAEVSVLDDVLSAASLEVYTFTSTVDVLAKPVDPHALMRAVTRGLERSARIEAERVRASGSRSTSCANELATIVEQTNTALIPRSASC
jgi:FixJ family two-component response regulator